MRTKLPHTVVILALVSFFNDLASDMVVPLLPIFLASILHAGPIALGLIEGVAEAIASFLKLWSGRRSDQLGGKRKPLTLLGYALSNGARPLFGLAASWVGILALRSVDRIGKGLRSAPRDALIADATAPSIRGYAYGFHRALDNGGAVLGGLLAAAILAWSTTSIPQVMLWSALPGALALGLLIFGIREKTITPLARSQPLPPLSLGGLSQGMRRYLFIIVVFIFAKASETFIVLRGYELGMSPVLLLLLWSALNFAKALTSTWGGQLSDRFGQKKIMLFSWSGYVLAFLMLALLNQTYALWGASIFLGLIAGLSEGAERALISLFSDVRNQGTGFGWYYLMSGLAAIPAGLLFGGVWQFQGAGAAFFMAAFFALLAVLLLTFWRGKEQS